MAILQTNQELKAILGSVKTIALVGASDKPHRDSHIVLTYLAAKGYDTIPVNPKPGLTEIDGLKVYKDLASIDRPVDMVEVFRRSEELMDVTKQAIEIGAQVVWAQLGVIDDEAAWLAEEAGLTMVMDRCPKIELER